MEFNNVRIGIAAVDVLLDTAMDEKCTEKLAAAKLEAVKTAVAIYHGFLCKGIREDLLFRILERRLDMIRNASTQSQLNAICYPKAPHYNGGQFMPSSEFSIPEEEMLLWSMTSLKGPLISAGFERYMELFRLIFGGLPGEADFHGGESLC